MDDNNEDPAIYPKSSRTYFKKNGTNEENLFRDTITLMLVEPIYLPAIQDLLSYKQLILLTGSPTT